MGRVTAGSPSLLVYFTSQNVSEYWQESEVLFSEYALGDLNIYTIPTTKDDIKSILYSGWDRVRNSLYDAGAWF